MAGLGRQLRTAQRYCSLASFEQCVISLRSTQGLAEYSSRTYSNAAAANEANTVDEALFRKKVGAFRLLHIPSHMFVD